MLTESAVKVMPHMSQPTDPAQRPPLVTLSSGLRVRLLQTSYSAKAAVLVRVHAGGHDAPDSYPGLAHFLEHLLFLGSHGYAADQSLMPFVQRCGGQLNASTRERHTDFFFQVQARQLEEGLRRLLDMLTHPLLDPADQMREREVLQAEFHARAQDVETLCDAALGTAFDSAHPFAGFHAGHRATLPIEDSAFQQALLGYHQRFYHSGQIELLLAGPQTFVELQRLACLADNALAPGRGADRVAPALHCRRDTWLRVQIEQAQPRLHLAFALADMPDYCAPALDYLSTWIASEAPGGLVQRLRSEGLCQAMALRVPYWYAGQGVAVVEVLLTEQGLAERGRIVAAVQDWLRFFADDARWQPCRDEYQRIEMRRLQGAEPLELLRHWVEPLAWGRDSDEVASHQALAVLLAEMSAASPLVLTADKAACEPIHTLGFPLRMTHERPQHAVPTTWHWEQPEPNRWLQPYVERRQAQALPLALRWLGPEDSNGQAALHVRWHFTAATPPLALWHAVSHALQPSRWAAQQAGVVLRFEDMGDVWSLGLQGFAEAIPAIARDTLRLIVELPATALAQGNRLAEREAGLGGDEMLIRQLLRRLPQLMAGAKVMDTPSVAPAQRALSDYLQAAQWQGLEVGFADDLRGALGEAVNALPGEADGSLVAALTADSADLAQRWHHVSGGACSTETALLLFCPLPSRTPACEASWRLLAHLVEGDFFRRLRSELQLGYAVFSRFHQPGGQPGVLFGVQSPTASAREILGHIQAFMDGFAVTLADLPPVEIGRVAVELSERHVVGFDNLSARADQAWASCLAGHDVTRPSAVAEAMRNLQRRDLSAALESMRVAASGWVVVSNAAAPDQSWR